MLARNLAPFSALVTRYNTTVVDGMVSWFPLHTVEAAPLSWGRAAHAVAGNGLRPAPTQSRQRHHGSETNPYARTRGPGKGLTALRRRSRARRHALGMGASAW